MRTTLKKINAALAAKGYTDTLERGKGYFYFWGGPACGWYSSSVATFHLTSMTVEQWVEMYERMAQKENKK